MAVVGTAFLDLCANMRSKCMSSPTATVTRGPIQVIALIEETPHADQCTDESAAPIAENVSAGDHSDVDLSDHLVDRGCVEKDRIQSDVEDGHDQCSGE